jgi:prepilin-type N-terminal cleavage/methylation domain-containing protein
MKIMKTIPTKVISTKIAQTARASRGFTILETLVAIAILLISIAGPLTIAEKSLVTAANSENQMIASYLAEDLMEYIENIRDNNLLLINNGSGTSWLAIKGENMLDICSTTGNSTACDFDTMQSAVSPTITTCHAEAIKSALNGQNVCQLYLDPTPLNASDGSSYYSSTQTSGAPATKFWRGFTVTPMSSNNATATSTLVTVTVEWNTGGVREDVVLQNILFNTTR